MTISRALARPLSRPLKRNLYSSTASFTPDFYVDSVNGSDSNDGLTAAAAFETLGAAETAALSFGDNVSVGLAYGSEWREAIDLSSLSGASIVAYGTPTALPVVRGDEIFDTAWANSTDRADANTAVYSRTVTIDNPIAGQFWAVHWENGVRLIWASSIALCQSTPGTFYSPTLSTGNTTGTSYTIYIHPYGNTDPRSDGKTYEYTKRLIAVKVGNSGIVTRINGKRSAQNNGCIEGGFDCTFTDCLASGALRHTMLIASGTFNRCVGWMDSDDTRTGYIVMEIYTFSDATGRTATWNNCIAVVENLIGSTMGVGFGGHTSDASQYASATQNDCATKNGNVSMGDVVNVYDNRTRYDNAGFLAFQTGDAALVDPYVTVSGSVFNKSSYGVFCIVGTEPDSMSIEGARVYVDGDLPSSANGVLRRITGTGSITLRRSAIKFTSQIDVLGSEASVLRENGSGTFTLDGNLIDIAASPVRGVFLRESVGGTTNIVGSNNAYHAGTQNFRFNNGATNVAASVQIASETNSIVSNPSFVDPANGDFTATATGLPANSGLERDPTCLNYTPIPASIDAAEAWILE